MKLLIVFSCIALTFAAPAARPDDSDDSDDSPSFSTVIHRSHPVPVGSASTFVRNIVQQPVTYTASFAAPAVATHSGAVTNFIQTSGGSGFSGSRTVSFDDDSDDDDSSISGGSTVFFKSGGDVSAVAPSVSYVSTGGAAAVAAPPAAVSFAPTGQVTYQAPAVATVQQKVPVVTTYSASAAPAQGFISAAAPARTTHIVNAPAVAQAVSVAAAPAVPVTYKAATVQVAQPVQVKQHVVQTVQQPVVPVVPSAVTYRSQQVVDLGTKEIEVPVQTHHVTVPVEKRVHYGVEKFVTGSQTTIHKPKLSAPAIAAPQILVSKTHHAAPEVTVKHSQVVVEESSPNYVAAPYDAGVVVEYAQPDTEEIEVPTPVEVRHPVAVPTPYAVPLAQPIKVKSAVNPVINVDLHTVETEDVVTPVQYTTHHHVAAAAVPAAAPAAAVFTAASPAVTTYGAQQQFVQGAVRHGAVAAVPTVTTYSSDDDDDNVKVSGVPGVATYTTSGHQTGGFVQSAVAVPSVATFAAQPQVAFQAVAAPAGSRFVASGHGSAVAGVPTVTTYSTGAANQAVATGGYTQGHRTITFNAPARPVITTYKAGTTTGTSVGGHFVQAVKPQISTQFIAAPAAKVPDFDDSD